jgi:prepilin-type processing-associated H-X9-DG protein
MDRRRGLSRTEVLVILSVVGAVALFVLCWGILMLAQRRAREQAKRTVCLNNLKILMLALNMYLDDNDYKIVNGMAGMDRKEDGVVVEKAWTGRDWHDDYKNGAQLDSTEQERAIRSGALGEYCRHLGAYRCPAGLEGEMRTYSIVDSMNGQARKGTDDLVVKSWMRIRNPRQRLVFVDIGWATPSSFAVHYDKEQWWDPPPVRHGDGTNVSFADLHTECWKWKGTDTIKLGRSADRTRPRSHISPDTAEGKEDLHRFQIAVWGKLGYTPGD